MPSGVTLRRRVCRERSELHFVADPVLIDLTCSTPAAPGFCETGSHIRLARGNRNVTVLAHSSLAPKTLQSILRQAGIDLETFLDSLRYTRKLDPSIS
ncbi:MAG: type II toxin-antitoxin system HicA family toxin [Acidobacteriota bacterium]|nr:type II toxin-antitoxin system HicA family toxin [Acidobacteriota bacterium]